MAWIHLRPFCTTVRGPIRLVNQTIRSFRIGDDNLGRRLRRGEAADRDFVAVIRAGRRRGHGTGRTRRWGEEVTWREHEVTADKGKDPANAHRIARQRWRTPSNCCSTISPTGSPCDWLLGSLRPRPRSPPSRRRRRTLRSSRRANAVPFPTTFFAVPSPFGNSRTPGSRGARFGSRSLISTGGWRAEPCRPDGSEDGPSAEGYGAGPGCGRLSRKQRAEMLPPERQVLCGLAERDPEVAQQRQVQQQGELPGLREQAGGGRSLSAWGEVRQGIPV